MRVRTMLTYETATALTAGKLRKARERNDSESSALNSRLIAEGRGSERLSETRMKTDSLSLGMNALMDEAKAIHMAAEKMHGPSWIVRV